MRSWSRLPTQSSSVFAPQATSTASGAPGMARYRTVESAGLLLFRNREGRTEVLLVHPGGPFWKKRDEGAWSIPKGEIESGEAAIDVARREFEEELGQAAPDGDFMQLGSVRQAGGKAVHAWAAPGDFDVTCLDSACFAMVWQPSCSQNHNLTEVVKADLVHV